MLGSLLNSATIPGLSLKCSYLRLKPGIVAFSFGGSGLDRLELLPKSCLLLRLRIGDLGPQDVPGRDILHGGARVEVPDSTFLPPESQTS